MELTNFPYPEDTDYPEYFRGYVRNVEPGVRILHQLGTQRDAMLALLRPVDEEASHHRYAPGKWSLKEMMGHLADSERVFAFRAVHAARQDAAILPNMEQDSWVSAGDFERVAWSALVEAYHRTRDATIALFLTFTPEMGGASTRTSAGRFTAGAFPYIIAGHELHHQRVMRELYGLR